MQLPYSENPNILEGKTEISYEKIDRLNREKRSRMKGGMVYGTDGSDQG